MVVSRRPRHFNSKMGGVGYMDLHCCFHRSDIWNRIAEIKLLYCSKSCEESLLDYAVLSKSVSHTLISFRSTGVESTLMANTSPTSSPENTFGSGSPSSCHWYSISHCFFGVEATSLSIPTFGGNFVSIGGCSEVAISALGDSVAKPSV
jgi:hypothetical protein